MVETPVVIGSNLDQTVGRGLTGGSVLENESYTASTQNASSEVLLPKISYTGRGSTFTDTARFMTALLVLKRSPVTTLPSVP